MLAVAVHATDTRVHTTNHQINNDDGNAARNPSEVVDLITTECGGCIPVEIILIEDDKIVKTILPNKN